MDHTDHTLFFPECVAKGSRFTFGRLGVDPCSCDPAFGVRKRPQASASVRNRPQPSATVRNPLQPSSTVLNRPQPSSTVFNRPQPSVCDRRGRKVAVPLGKVAKDVAFLTCQKLWSCRFAWQAWHFMAFQHVSRRVKKSFCVAVAILLLHFQKMCCIFRGRRSTLGTSDVISVAGAAL